MPATTTTLLDKQLTLSDPPKPAGHYVPVLRYGTVVVTSGMLPLQDGKVHYIGPVTDETLAEGQAAARLAVLNALAALKAELGDLSAVVQVVKLTGFVHAASGFAQHPQVMNAASELLTEWFGPAGRHTRSAIGVASLPLNAMVELELMVTTREQPL
jgi:enamine deaminase RidA (YjgF/YER057c/UK114 family)